MPVLVDAGVLYAMVDRSDAWHRRVVAWLDETRPLLLVPATVVPEAAYLVRTRVSARAEQRLIDGVAEGGATLEAIRDTDLRRTAALMKTYPDLGFTDCSVVAIAERLSLTTIATTDRRHFGMVRPRHADGFTLVP